MYWYYFIALLLLLVDQVTKWIIVAYMELNESISVLGEFFYITSHRNRGAAFGILQDARWFFVVITTFVLVAIIYFIYKLAKEQRRLLCVALSFILGGALGNFIDRVRSGEVVDFLHFRFQFTWFSSEVDYHFAIFNVADTAITIGFVLVILDTFLQWRKEKRGLVANESQQSE